MRRSPARELDGGEGGLARWIVAGSITLLTGLLVGISAGALGNAEAQSTIEAPPTSVIVELPEEPGVLSVGRPFDVLVEVVGSSEAPPRLPRWRQRWGDAEIVAIKGVEEEGGAEELATTYRQRLTLRIFRPGLAVLPPVAIWAGEEPVLTQAAAVEIAAMLPTDAAGPLPPAPLRSLPGLGGFWIAGLILLLLSVLGVFLLHRRRLTAAPGAPDDELLRTLRRLRRRMPDPVAFHHALSQALRRFLGRSLRFDGARSSTRQIEQALIAARVPDHRLHPVTDLLRQCDAVRFGGHASTRQVMIGRLAAARKLANSWSAAATLAAATLEREAQETATLETGALEASASESGAESESGRDAS